MSISIQSANPFPTVVIFGATSEIAAAVVRSMAGWVDRFVLVARRPEALAPLKQELVERGIEDVTCLPQDADLGAHLPHGADYVLIAYGSMEGAETHAGVRAAMEANYFAVADAVEAVAPYMTAGGSLGIVTSVAAERVRRGAGAYGIAKSAASGYAALLRQRNPAYRIVEIRPGPTITAMTRHLPHGKLWATPQQIAPAIVGALLKGTPVIRVPAIWNLIMPVIRMLPEALFARLGHRNQPEAIARTDASNAHV